MKRLSPDERKYILHQNLRRLHQDWMCRYGQWNTTKMLGELRLLLRKVGKDGLEALETPQFVAATDDDLPLFSE
ncbi:MAG: hypothetical protein JW993_09875 [Sedimentisphaerales bacterium]|nr:hypothetical protein [Sedimentisphaerales bacterium]